MSPRRAPAAPPGKRHTPPTLTTHRATLNAYDDVDVTASGPRGGTSDWTVMFSRLGRLAGSYRHTPDPRYFEPDDTPTPLVSAAVAARRDAGVRTPLLGRPGGTPSEDPR